MDYMPRPGVLGIRRLDFERAVPTWDIMADARALPVAGSASGRAARGPLVSGGAAF